MAQRIVIGIFLTSLLVASVAMFMGHQSLAKYFAAPALAFSGWAALGHLVTLDDEAPGEWSNPEGSKAIWKRSVVELIIKVVVFAAVGIAFYV
ncbi:hypothetical protein [Marinobacter sp. F3R11]|uniref:hypothetical protein n=2 Tax=Marinobacter sp. F3R11 TaxID=2267231 RepID=UPI000DEB0F7C|nr:hypothetical protein [Marinobacter sp. F3R11]RBW50343.1 hypothetical protein DS878_04940 [Marinobacter sp. F3R11]